MTIPVPAAAREWAAHASSYPSMRCHRTRRSFSTTASAVCAIRQFASFSSTTIGPDFDSPPCMERHSWSGFPTSFAVVSQTPWWFRPATAGSFCARMASCMCSAVSAGPGESWEGCCPGCHVDGGIPSTMPSLFAGLASSRVRVRLARWRSQTCKHDSTHDPSKYMVVSCS